MRIDRQLYDIEDYLGEAMFSKDWKEFRLMLEDIKETLKDD